MPSKRKRAASRQAKLSGRRKRRGGGRRQRQEGSGTLVASPTARQRSAASTTETVATQTQRPAVAVQPTQQRRARNVATAPMARTRASQSRAATYEPLPMYAYLGSELKRIGAITAIMAIALAALTVVLG